jgi:hypothetical protein
VHQVRPVQVNNGVNVYLSHGGMKNGFWVRLAIRNAPVKGPAKI